MRSAYLRSTISSIRTSGVFGSRGSVMSLTTPTVTPEIFTGFPSARPATSTKRTSYSFLRDQIFCSEPMKNRNIISTASEAEISNPTRIVFDLEVFGMCCSLKCRWAANHFSPEC